MSRNRLANGHYCIKTLHACLLVACLLVVRLLVVGLLVASLLVASFLFIIAAYNKHEALSMQCDQLINSTY